MTVEARGAYKYFNSLASATSGRPLAGHYVRFFFADTGLEAPYYTDDTGLILNTIPVTTDSNGYFEAYLPADYYDISFYQNLVDYAGYVDSILDLFNIVHDGFTSNVASQIGFTANGTIDSQNVQDAITEVNSEVTSSLQNIVGTNITQDTTVSVASVGAYNNIITITDGITLTINGSFEAGLYQVFDCQGTGSVAGLSEAKPEWFDTNTTPGTTDMSTAIHKAVQSVTTGTIYLGASTYLLGTINGGTGNESTYIVAKDGVNIIGQGDTTILKVKDGENPVKLWNVINKPQGTGILSNCIYRDFKIYGGSNNLAGGDAVRSNCMIGGTDGGHNILIENITFSKSPGNNTVAFGGGTTGTRGLITVRGCRFFGMGEGITGNVCNDHSDIYLAGNNNKVIGNHAESDGFVRGAFFEFHGDYGEAYGNQVYNYGVAGYLHKQAAEGYTAFTETSIHDNTFHVQIPGLFLSGTEAGSFGVVREYNNIYRVISGAYADGVRICIYGPDATGAYLIERDVHDNLFINEDDSRLVLYFPYQTQNVKFHHNTASGFYYGVQLGNALIDATYANYHVSIQGNSFIDFAHEPVYAATSAPVKSLNIISNEITLEEPVNFYAITLGSLVDVGVITGNAISKNYAFPVLVGQAGWTIDQVDANGGRWLSNESSSNKMTLTKYSTAIPTTGAYYSAHIINSVPTVGQPKGWFLTVPGGAYSTTRADTTAYVAGVWAAWTTGDTIWECTTGGTTAGSPPDITGKTFGDTVTDGTAVWTYRASAKAVFTPDSIV